MLKIDIRYDPTAAFALPQASQQDGTHLWQSPGISVSIRLDQGYRLREFSWGILIDDGRVDTPDLPHQRWNGAFVALKWPCGTTHMSILTDRLGTVPVYFARDANHWLIASGLKSFVEAGFAEPDFHACWQLLMFNTPLWQKSLLKGVSLAPPASEIRFGDGAGPQMQGYWEAPAIVEGLLERQKILPELIHLLRQAHRRVVNPSGRWMLPVTGGLDSRINLALHRDDWSSAMLFHSAAGGDDEERIADRIAAVVRQPLYKVDRSESVICSLENDIWTETGELNFAQRWLEHTSRSVAERLPGGMLVDGYMQDVMFNPIIPTADPNATTLKRSLATASYYAKMIGLTPEKSELAEVLDLFRAEYSLANPSSALHASQRFYLHNRSRRYVYGMVRLAQNFAPVATPGLDIDLLDFGFALPWKNRVGAELYRCAIIQLAPDLAAVTYDKTGLPLSAPPGKSWRLKMRNKAEHYLDHLWPGRPFFNGADADLPNLLRRHPIFAARLCNLLAASGWLANMLGRTYDVAHLVRRVARGEQQLRPIVLGMVTIALLENAVRMSAGNRQ